jgi:cytochrome bd-type quinol oxidase subunit 2
MLSVFAADALNKSTSEVRVRKTFLTISVCLSVFYLAMLLLTILSQPLVQFYNPDTKLSRIQTLETSNLWLAPLQGLVVVAIGVLFFLKEQGNQGAARQTP